MWRDLALVYGAYVIAAGSPGPSTMAIMAVAMKQGRASASALAAGIVTISFLWGLVAAMGLATLLSTYVQALNILKLCGGLYLFWLAFKSARSALRKDDAPRALNTVLENTLTLYRRGVLMHLGNPKAILSWLALMSLGVGAHAPPEQVAFAFGGCILLGTIIFFGYALLFSTAPMVRGYARACRWIEGTLSLAFAGAGLRLIISR